MGEYGIVEIFPYEKKDKTKCGYCKNKSGSLSYGMWGHNLTVDNYQDLTDRGWRRSGQYCYKPDMKETCCPQYTIRCEVDKFELSKSQKTVLRRMKQFLSTGKVKTNVKQEVSGESEEVEEWCVAEEVAQRLQCNRKEVLGADPSLPLRKKAKVIRMERKKEKLATKMTSSSVEMDPQTGPKTKQQQCQAKSFCQRMQETHQDNETHQLKVLTVRPTMSNRRFRESFATVYELYRKYQVSVHLDKPDKCTRQQFQRFLVDSPLNVDDDVEGENDVVGYGSYHQQYWLNGNQLIAVGVIDILPKYVSAVYFFYDPEYNFLSLGNYGALREIAFTQSLKPTHPQMQYYLMGFYIHSCVKMRYKGQYKPSFLLCPETFTWQPIEDAKKKLDVAKYSRLDENSKSDSEEVIKKDELMILYKRNAITYKDYCEVKRVGENEKRDISTYAELVGRKAASRILLYRSSN
ncbi:Arginyl-tRNA--protein transferase 1 [Chamberlinius hualienensis]